MHVHLIAINMHMKTRMWKHQIQFALKYILLVIFYKSVTAVIHFISVSTSMHNIVLFINYIYSAILLTIIIFAPICQLAVFNALADCLLNIC